MTHNTKQKDEEAMKQDELADEMDTETEEVHQNATPENMDQAYEQIDKSNS